VERDIYRSATRKFDFQIGVARANGSGEGKREREREREREKEAGGTESYLESLYAMSVY